MDLRKEYKKETKCNALSGDGHIEFFNDEYVQWLEAKLNKPDVAKSLPNNDKVYDMAVNYIVRSGIINKPDLRDEVFRAYKYGCRWMRKQLK